MIVICDEGNRLVTFVLVHGTSHGGWCWRNLSPILRKAGYEVYTPTLTGLGERSHLLSKIDRITLETHIEDVTNMLFYEDLSDVVLVGHSYAGMVITGVATKQPQRLSHLVYFDAYIPSKGESEIDLWPPDVQARARADIAKGLKTRPLPPDFAGFLGVTDPKLAEWMEARFTPHPFSTYEDAPPSDSSESDVIPRSYIHCTEGHVASWMADMKTFAAKARSLRWRLYELAAGHDAMLTHPEELAKILLEIATGRKQQ